MNLPLPIASGGTGKTNMGQAAFSLFQTAAGKLQYIYGEPENNQSQAAGYRSVSNFISDYKLVQATGDERQVVAGDGSLMNAYWEDVTSTALSKNTNHLDASLILKVNKASKLADLSMYGGYFIDLTMSPTLVATITDARYRPVRAYSTIACGGTGSNLYFISSQINTNGSVMCNFLNAIHPNQTSYTPVWNITYPIS